MRLYPKFFAAGLAIGISFLLGQAAPTAHAEVDQPQPLMIALKFIEFKNSNGKPVLSREKAQEVVAGVNSVYAQCGVRMRLEHYEAVDPAAHGLTQKIRTPDDMDSVRAPFDSDRHLVIIHTGNWNHRTMGAANAWTAMPGQTPAGAVLESLVADNGNITAHEIGHYLGLDHSQDDAELMNPIIYSSSVRITPTQCQQLRQTALASRAGALRSV